MCFTSYEKNQPRVHANRREEAAVMFMQIIRRNWCKKENNYVIVFRIRQILLLNQKCLREETTELRNVEFIVILNYEFFQLSYWLIFNLIKNNPFVPNAPFLYPLNASENLTVFRCFQGLEKGCIGNEWVNQFSHLFQCFAVFCINLRWS